MSDVDRPGIRPNNTDTDNYLQINEQAAIYCHTEGDVKVCLLQTTHDEIPEVRREFPRGMKMHIIQSRMHGDIETVLAQLKARA